MTVKLAGVAPSPPPLIHVELIRRSSGFDVQMVAVPLFVVALDSAACGTAVRAGHATEGSNGDAKFAPVTPRTEQPMLPEFANVAVMLSPVRGDADIAYHSSSVSAWVAV